MDRRGCFWTVFWAATLVSLPSFAGSYLNRAALLLHAANTDADYLRARINDRELARVVQKVAEARVLAARTMDIPKEVAAAHPHLLLVFENLERAAQAAVDGNAKAFIALWLRARDEEQAFKAILKQSGYTLPELK